MLERNYSGVQAYCQSKLALVMLTFDLAEEPRAAASRPTAAPRDLLADQDGPRVRDRARDPIGGRHRSDHAPDLLPEVEGVNGHYFDGTSESAPPQAEDPEARRQLRELHRAHRDPGRGVIRVAPGREAEEAKR